MSDFSIKPGQADTPFARGAVARVWIISLPPHLCLGFHLLYRNHIIIIYIYISYLTPLQKLNSKFRNIELSTTIICDKTAQVLTTLGSDLLCPENSRVYVLKGFSGCRIV